METYNIEGVPFIASDDEVFTRDMQPVFVEIRGQVFRPSKTSIKQLDSDGPPILFSEEEIKQHYVNYRRIYTSDDVMTTQIDVDLGCHDVVGCVNSTVVDVMLLDFFFAEEDRRSVGVELFDRGF